MPAHLTRTTPMIRDHARALLRLALPALLATLLMPVAARAAENAPLARARENVAYEHAHLGLVGKLMCGNEVAWMDARLADFEHAVAKQDWADAERDEDYVKSAITDLRRAEDSHTIDLVAVLGIVIVAGGVGFWLVRRRRNRAAV